MGDSVSAPPESEPESGNMSACDPAAEPRMLAGYIEIMPLWLRFRRPKTESL